MIFLRGVGRTKFMEFCSTDAALRFDAVRTVFSVYDRVLGSAWETPMPTACRFARSESRGPILEDPMRLLRILLSVAYARRSL